jgi:hypothetical protein
LAGLPVDNSMVGRMVEFLAGAESGSVFVLQPAGLVQAPSRAEM